MLRILSHGGVAILAAVAIGLATTDAAAAAPVPSPQGSAAAMYIDHFDAAVAAEHGYKIVVGPDGIEQSIPVTAAAKAEARAFAAAISNGGATTNGSDTVVGPCGTSSVKLERTGMNVRATTSYSVYAPVTTRVWNVTLYGAPGVATIPFSGGPSGKSWGSFGVIPYSTGGWGHVTPGSFVILTNGAFCYSGAPGAGF